MQQRLIVGLVCAATQLIDTIFEAVFPLLYAFEPDGMLDSSKNLRVLWVRALLSSLGKLDDDVAFELLPSASRWLVGKPFALLWPAAVTEKLDWIVKRTTFIDAAVDAFIAIQPAEAPPAQLVLLGSGYDTRALRYGASARGRLSFFEVDLPDVVDAKMAIRKRMDTSAGPPPAISMLGCDLNKGAGSVFERLQAECGLDPAVPTLVCIEAVLFYLSPPAKSALLGEISTLLAGQPASSLVLTDNLAPFVRGPMRDAAEGYLSPMGLSLRQHDTLWGGAIQFVEAEAAAGAPSS